MLYILSDDLVSLLSVIYSNASAFLDLAADVTAEARQSHSEGIHRYPIFYFAFQYKRNIPKVT